VIISLVPFLENNFYAHINIRMKNKDAQIYCLSAKDIYDWSIYYCLTSSEQYFSYIQNENKLNNI